MPKMFLITVRSNREWEDIYFKFYSFHCRGMTHSEQIQKLSAVLGAFVNHYLILGVFDEE